MKIGIIGAMEEEIRYLKKVINNQEEINYYGFEFTQGYLGQHEVVLGSEERRVGKECRSRWSPYH